MMLSNFIYLNFSSTEFEIEESKFMPIYDFNDIFSFFWINFDFHLLENEQFLQLLNVLKNLMTYAWLLPVNYFEV